MLKNEYYCLVAGLPDLFFTENKANTDCRSFRNLLATQLSHEDFRLVELLYLPADNENLLTVLLNRDKAFDGCGNFSSEFLREQLDPENEEPALPAYMLDFLSRKWNPEIEDLAFRMEMDLQKGYYESALQVKNDFLRRWFLFELNLKNILTEFACRKFGYNSGEQLVTTRYNKTSVPLLQKDHVRKELLDDENPFSFDIVKIAEADLSWLEREKAIDRLKWNYLDENTVFQYFTIEKILSHTIKLIILDRWMNLEKKTGEEMLERLVSDFGHVGEFPKEVSVSN